MNQINLNDPLFKLKEVWLNFFDMLGKFILLVLFGALTRPWGAWIYLFANCGFLILIVNNEIAKKQGRNPCDRWCLFFFLNLGFAWFELVAFVPAVIYFKLNLFVTFMPKRLMHVLNHTIIAKVSFYYII
mmetsp:Transcript_41076/g.36413  ORF Transcript_41076/g.36413 Transcript_41076/m.36413 type:complete len:130 (-) Transcript_41076:341-730(-)